MHSTLSVRDIVINPDRSKSNRHFVCMICATTEKHTVLIPFTKKGYLSVDLNKRIYLHPSVELHPHSKYPHAELCPVCSDGGDKFDLTFVMKKLSIYEDLYRCRVCKQTFELPIRLCE